MQTRSGEEEKNAGVAPHWTVNQSCTITACRSIFPSMIRRMKCKVYELSPMALHQAQLTIRCFCTSHMNNNAKRFTEGAISYAYTAGINIHEISVAFGHLDEHLE